MTKVTLMILTSNDEDCASFYTNTGAVVAPEVTIHYREIDLPNMPKGWGIRSVHLVKNTDDPMKEAK